MYEDQIIVHSGKVLLMSDITVKITLSQTLGGPSTWTNKAYCLAEFGGLYYHLSCQRTGVTGFEHCILFCYFFCQCLTLGICRLQTDWTLNQSGQSAQGRAWMSNLHNLILCCSRLGRAFNQRPVLEGGGADSGQKYSFYFCFSFPSH